MLPKLRLLNYGWVIVGVSFFTLFLSLGIRFSFGVFYVAILQEYSWGRGETAGAYSIAMLVHGLFAPVTGILIDRYGPRLVFPLGSIFLALSLFAASTISTILGLYLVFGVFLAIAINTLSSSPHMSIIPRWFTKRRGLASGLVLAGMGVGNMVLAPLSQFIIESLGWRYAFLTLAFIVMTLLVPVTALLHRRLPKNLIHDSEMTFSNAPPSSSKVMTKMPKVGPSYNLLYQWHLKKVIATKAFWFLTLSLFCNGFFSNMLLVHQVAYTVDIGHGYLLAALLLGLVGLIGSIGSILCGILSDLVGRRVAYTLGGACALIGALALIFAKYTPSPWLLYAFVILYGLGQGAMPPINAVVTGDLFPGNSLGRILALHSIGFGLGGALGAFSAGYFYDQTGSYLSSFILLLVSIGLGVYGVLMAFPAYRKLVNSERSGFDRVVDR